MVLLSSQAPTSAGGVLFFAQGLTVREASQASSHGVRLCSPSPYTGLAVMLTPPKAGLPLHGQASPQRGHIYFICRET